MDSYERKRRRLFKKFAARVREVNLCIRSENLDTILRRLDEIQVEYDSITKNDIYANLEIRRRIAESRFLASIDMGGRDEDVDREFQALEFLGFTDLYQKATYYKVLWHFLKKKAENAGGESLLESLGKELRRSMAFLKEEIASIDDLLGRRKEE